MSHIKKGQVILLTAKIPTTDRPALISEETYKKETYKIMDDLRAFWHRERTSHIKDLDRKIVCGKFQAMNDSFAGLQEDFRLFSGVFFKEIYKPFPSFTKESPLTPVLNLSSRLNESARDVILTTTGKPN